MKKFSFALLLAVLLTGLLGCKSSRATLKTETTQELRQTEVTDSSRTENTKASDRITAALSSNEQKTVVIEFDEWEYYQPADTNTGGNYAHNKADFIRTDDGQEDKPPNVGNVKAHRKGTITINANRQTEQKADRQTDTATDIQEASDRKTTTDAATKEKTDSKEKKGNGKGYVWIVVGLLCAVLFVGTGIWIARKIRA